LAVAVGAANGINLSVTGALQAIDTSGSGKAYAIAAGTSGTNIWSVGGAVNDIVSLGNGASVTGRIELGGGTNLLTLDGAGILNGGVNNITTMTKTGSGTWATSGQLNTNDLAVRAGTLSLSSASVGRDLTVDANSVLDINVLQADSASVQIANTFTNNGEVSFSLEGLSPSETSFTVLTSGNPILGSGIYTSSSPLLTVNIVGNNIDLVFVKKPFPWELFLPAILNAKQNQ